MRHDAYASIAHLALNVTPPRTQWMNMGLWTQQDASFPDACQGTPSRPHASQRWPSFYTKPPTSRQMRASST